MVIAGAAAYLPGSLPDGSFEEEDEHAIKTQRSQVRIPSTRVHGMSGTLPANEPTCLNAESESVELVIDARPRDIGGFAVRRVLPAVARRAVGPFLFFDHMGPAELPPGAPFDVRPHPHISLATVTYLFDGAID